MKFRIDVFLIAVFGIALIAWAAGTVTDYVTFTPGAEPGVPAEGMIYYNAANDIYYQYDDGAAFWPMGPEVYGFEPVSSPVATAEGYVYYDSDVDFLYVRTGGAAWEQLNGSTLDTTYDQGIAITVDAGAIALTNTEVDAQATLTIANSGAAGTGAAIAITDSKTGAHASMTMALTAGNASSGGLHIYDNAANATDLAYLVKLESVDATKEIVDALLISATTNAMITDAIDVSDPEITNAINIGANTITGTTFTFDTSTFDIDSAGDITHSETGGNAADPDTDMAGYYLLGATDGGGLGGATHKTNFSSAGVQTMSGNARPTHTDYVWTSELDLVTVHGDQTAPTENEAGSTFNFSSWTYTEANADVTFYLWPIPEDMDVSAALNIFLIWTTEDAGGDTCLWKVQYDFWAVEAEAIDNTWIALDTIVADDTAGQFNTALTGGGQIAAATFTDGDLVLLQFSLTDCNDGAEADLIGFEIQYYKEKP